METLHDFPVFFVKFTKDGQVFDQAEVNDLLTYLPQAAVTDLLVLSHGWNNDMDEAHDLYDRLLAHLRPYAPAGRTFAVLGVQWPSKKFADENLIPSGAASGESPVTTQVLQEELDRLKKTFDAPDADERLAQASALVPDLEDDPAAAAKFAELVRGMVPGPQTSPDTDGAETLMQAPAAGLLDKLGQPVLDLQDPASSGSATMGQVASADDDGQVSGIGQFFSGIKAGALNLLNYTTYYQMKERAGLVGSHGLRTVLAAARQAVPSLKLHLVGHSFGGRLVTAAASDQMQFKVNTLSLLQAAFSHYGFSQDYDDMGSTGFFRPMVVGHTVSGPVLITHSAADTAVGHMYPLASRIMHQIAAGLGDANDIYGGIGRNGAQKTAEASDYTLLPAAGTYAFQAGHLHNLNADGIIQNHSDICHDEVGSAIMQAIATT